MASINSSAAVGGAGDVSPTGTSGPNPATNPKMRKRTKTGCLTCRKRRIKCGEERPTCANCIKSKRQCEGYNQRVVFKPPIGDWPHHPGVVSTLQYHNSMLPGSRATNYRPQSAPQPPENTLNSSQPRPLASFDYAAENASPLGHLNTQVLASAPQQYAQDSNFHHHQPPLHSPHHPPPTPTSTTSYFPQPSPAHPSFQGQYSHETTNLGYQELQRYPQSPYQQIPVSYDTPVDQKPSISRPSQEQVVYQHHQQATGRPEEQPAYLQHSSLPSQAEDYPQYPEHRPSIHRYGSHSQAPLQQPPASSAELSQAASYNLPAAVSHPSDFSYSAFQPVQIPRHDMTSDVKHMPQHAVYDPPGATSQAQQDQPSIPLSGFAGEDHVSPTQVLDEAAVENEDDDYYDVLSDEEMMEGDDGTDEDVVILNRDFSLIRRIHFENTSELAIRRYDAFIYEGILTQYKAEFVANPLKNPKTARVFAHFIHVTGPSLAIYERNPRNPTSIFEGPTHPSQQSLWTYILPVKALNHQGLLHAMLALASLHIARLQRASVTPSYKHYAYALKRLGRSLGNAKKRHSIPTLATSLLLAFYEVMTAEHVKWSTHLVGGAHLLAELDFRSLTQEARRLKAAQTEQESKFPHHNPHMLIDQKQFNQNLKERAMMPDESLVSTIVGKKISYDDFGRVFEDGDIKQGRRSNLPGKLDLRTYETLQDLYWWYSRQDAFQSIVSGNPLITDYRKWSDCPPRAPLGRADALYGTHDHIILLVARIADFTVRDRERKLRQMEADGGQWRPRPGMPGMGPMGPPPGKGPASQPPTPTTPMGPPPHMQGMGGPGFGPPPGHGPPPGYGPPLGQGQGQGPPRGPPPGASAMPNFFGMAPSRPPIPLPTSYANPDFEHSPEMPHTPHPKYSDLPAAYEAALADWNSISAAHATIARFLANTEAFAPLTPDLYPVAPGGNMTPFGPALVHRSYDISTLWTLLHLSNILLLRSHPAMPPAAVMAAGVCAQATQPYATLIGRIAAGMQIPASDDTPLSPFLGSALIELTMALFFAGIQYQDPVQREWLVKRLLDIDRRTGWASAGVIARSCETSWERAAELGRGPPYPQRRTRRFGEDGPVVIDADGEGNEDGWGGGGVVRPSASSSRGGRGGAAGRGRGEIRREDWSDERERRENEDSRFVVRSVPWAKNLLSTDEDLRMGMERVGLSGRSTSEGGRNG